MESSQDENEKQYRDIDIVPLISKSIGKSVISQKIRKTYRQKNKITISETTPIFSNHDDYFIIVKVGSHVEGELFNHNPTQRIPFSQLRMRFGSMTLVDYLQKIDRLLQNWLSIQIHLAEGLKILHSKGMIHGDLNFSNILIDDDNVPRIINFETNYILTRLTEEHIKYLTFSPKYDNYAPELDYIAGITNFKNKDLLVDNIYNNKKILSEIDEMFPTLNGIKHELANFANRVDDSNVLNFIQKYGRAADIWTFGHNFYRLYMFILTLPIYIESEFYNNHHGAQMKILKGMLQPDPRIRFTADDILTELYTMRMS